MVQSGKVVWDLIDFDASKAVVLDAEGLLQPIDYSIVDKNKVYPGWAYKAGVAFYIYSSVLTFDTAKLKERSPTAGRISGTSRNSPASAPCARRRKAASRRA